MSTPWSGPKRGHQALPGLLLGLTHAGQTNWFSLMLHDVERTGFQVFRHGGDFIKLPALDFGEEAAELPDLTVDFPGGASVRISLLLPLQEDHPSLLQQSGTDVPHQHRHLGELG